MIQDEDWTKSTLYTMFFNKGYTVKDLYQAFKERLQDDVMVEVHKKIEAILKDKGK